MATEAKLKLALVGCGIISRHHITAAATARPRRIQITAVIDPNAERRGVAAAAVLELFGERPLEFDSLASAATADPHRAVFSAVDIMVRVPQRAERVEGTFGWD
jgi:predicted dehydrogenase